MHNESRKFANLDGDRKLSVEEAEAVVETYGGLHNRPIGTTNSLFVVARMDVMPTIAAQINKKGLVTATADLSQESTPQPPPEESQAQAEPPTAAHRSYNPATGKFEG